MAKPMSIRISLQTKCSPFLQIKSQANNNLLLLAPIPTILNISGIVNKDSVIFMETTMLFLKTLSWGLGFKERYSLVHYCCEL